jgi:peptidoglycan pentaglycine glycine transferase (the first glycine)
MIADSNQRSNNGSLKWENFLSNFNNVHLMQTANWGDLKSIFGWEVSRVITKTAGAQLMFKKLCLGLTWAYLPKGPVGDNWDYLWPLVDEVCIKQKAVFLKVEPNHWGDADNIVSQSFNNPRFRVSKHNIQPPRTILLDINLSDDEILAQMKQKTRYNIRLASRKGVLVSPTKEILKFYDMMQVTGERDSFGVHSFEYYKKAYDLFYKDGQCELFFAEFEGNLLAAVMVFINQKRAWYFYGASSNQHRNLMAPYAAQWEAIRWARSKGCMEYDLWGVPDKKYKDLEAEFTSRGDGLWGVYRFKRGFGGSLERSVGTWDRVYKPGLYKIYNLWVKKYQS